jgi:hypothetical protein
MSTIETMLDGVTWIPVTEETAPEDGMPHATHSGSFNFLGVPLRVFRLNTGEAVIHADDMNALLEVFGN